jgi:hypothetical protein
VYRRYADEMRAFVESKGGRFLWIGRVEPWHKRWGGTSVHRLHRGADTANQIVRLV